jgi:hypothetical protein
MSVLVGGDVGTVAADRGSNIVKALRLMAIPQQECDGHVLGVAIADALGLKMAKRGGATKTSSNPAVFKMFRRCTRMNGLLAASTLWKTFADEELDGASRMVQHHAIRWRSDRAMLLRQAECVEEIQIFALKSINRNKFNKMRPDEEWRKFVTEASAVLTAPDAFYGYIQTTSETIVVKSFVRRQMLIESLQSSTVMVPNVDKDGAPLESRRSTSLCPLVQSLRNKLRRALLEGPWGQDPNKGHPRRPFHFWPRRHVASVRVESLSMCSRRCALMRFYFGCVFACIRHCSGAAHGPVG